MKKRNGFFIKIQFFTFFILVLFAGFSFCTPSAAGIELRVLPIKHDDIRNLPALQSIPAEIRDDPNVWVWIARGGKGKTPPTLSAFLPETQAPHDIETHAVGIPKNCYVLMIDDSKSMRNQWPHAQEAMKTIWNTLPHQDLGGIYTFSDALVRIHPMGPVDAFQDAPLSEAIDSLKPVGNNTAMYAALSSSFSDLTSCPAVNRHVIIFSDGDAEDQAYTSHDVITEANRQNIIIHTIGFSYQSPGKTALKQDILKRLATETGGLYQFYTDIAQLERAFQDELSTHNAMGVIQVRDLSTLPFGQKKIMLRFQFAENGHASEILTREIPLSSTQNFENFLVSLRLQFGGVNPWWILAGIPTLIVLLLICLFMIRMRYRRKKQAAEDARREQWLADQKTQKRILEQTQEALINVAQKVAEFDASKAEFVPSEEVRPKGQPYGWLVDLGGHVHELVTYSTRIGRAEENDVVLSDSYASSEHAILDFKKGQFIWTDRAPTNPTRINGVPVRGSRQIWPEDTIECGNTTLRFVLASEDADDSPKEKSFPKPPKNRTETKPTFTPSIDVADKQMSQNNGMYTERVIMSYASFWKRFGAVLVDGVLMFIAGEIMGFFIGFVLAILGESMETIIKFSFLCSIALGWLYFALMESSPSQATIGKMVMKLKVTDINGNRISFGRATGRHFAKIVSMIPLFAGYLVMLFTPKKQCLHDLLSDCLIFQQG